MSSAADANVHAMDIPFLGARRCATVRSPVTNCAPGFGRFSTDVYIARDADVTAAVKARAAWLSTGATLCGLSAAAVHGTKWLDPQAPAEIVRANPHAQKDIIDALPPG
jgi:hypothetical protein